MADAPLTIFQVAGRAMSAQLVRMNTTASNLANAGAITSSPDTAYRTMKPVFRTEYDKATGLATVNVERVVTAGEDVAVEAKERARHGGGREGLLEGGGLRHRLAEPVAVADGFGHDGGERLCIARLGQCDAAGAENAPADFLGCHVEFSMGRRHAWHAGKENVRVSGSARPSCRRAARVPP